MEHAVQVSFEAHHRGVWVWVDSMIDILFILSSDSSWYLPEEHETERIQFPFVQYGFISERSSHDETQVSCIAADSPGS